MILLVTRLNVESNEGLGLVRRDVLCVGLSSKGQLRRRISSSKDRLSRVFFFERTCTGGLLWNMEAFFRESCIGGLLLCSVFFFFLPDAGTCLSITYNNLAFKNKNNNFVDQNSHKYCLIFYNIQLE